MCSTVQEQITTCGQNAIVKIGERTNIRPQKLKLPFLINLTEGAVSHGQSWPKQISCYISHEYSGKTQHNNNFLKRN